MVAGDWSNLTVAGAFVAGAVLATIAVLRVVRAVGAIFAADTPRVRPRRRDRDPGDRSTGEDSS